MTYKQRFCARLSVKSKTGSVQERTQMKTHFVWLDKGDLPEILRYVRVVVNKSSFEPFCVWILF